jgi:hypothetical protein
VIPRGRKADGAQCDSERERGASAGDRGEEAELVLSGREPHLEQRRAKPQDGKQQSDERAEYGELPPKPGHFHLQGGAVERKRVESHHVTRATAAPTGDGGAGYPNGIEERQWRTAGGELAEAVVIGTASHGAADCRREVKGVGIRHHDASEHTHTQPV